MPPTKRILNFELTSESIEEELSVKRIALERRAFQTILKNRVNRGGILAPGAGRINLGENGKGILSRWYPQTLYNRIVRIAEMRDRLTFIEGDGFEVIMKHAHSKNAVLFIDPPVHCGEKEGRSAALHTF